MWAGVKEACSWCSVPVLGTRQREQREEMVCGVSTCFLVDMACGLAGGACWSQGLGYSNEYEEEG